MTADIGIVGAGTAGLHLALMLQQRGVDASLYAERLADEVLAGRLANTVAHHHHTRERERELGVNHWDETGPSYGRHWHYFGGELPLAFPGDFAAPSLAVDYRLYQSRLLQDYEERGGSVRFGVVEAGVGSWLRSDLVSVSTGGWFDLFRACRAGRSTGRAASCPPACMRGSTTLTRSE
jgi:2-polyprenyl-6-methoxyphenol hydroxylase-like FAD-dependent oxidoreductase